MQAFEMPFVRLLHLIAHHPDCSMEADDVVSSAAYIQLYLDHVAHEKNVSLLYYLAGRLKTVRDPESLGRSEVCPQVPSPG